MTQDQTSQARGTGYVGRGQVVPDDETDMSQTEQSGAVTRLKKVASALRGDRPDPAVPDQTVPDQAVPEQAVQDQAVPDEMAVTSPVQQGQSGSWAAERAEDGAMNSTVREDEMNNGEYADATRPNEVGAVRSPQAAGRDYEVEQGSTGMTRNEERRRGGPFDSRFGQLRDDLARRHHRYRPGARVREPGRHGGRIRKPGRHRDRSQQLPWDDDPGLWQPAGRDQLRLRQRGRHCDRVRHPGRHRLGPAGADRRQAGRHRSRHH